MTRPREKDSTEVYRALNISALQRGCGLQPGGPFDWCWWRHGNKVASVGITVESRYCLRLRYLSRRHGCEPVQLDYPLTITWTPCHLGGQRPWFLCPCCGRRVGKLYSGEVFACRHCMRLNYRSQQVSKRDRALDQAWALRRKLGCDDGPFSYPAEYISRPNGMHRKTFAKRIEKLARIEQQAVANAETVLASLEHKLLRLERTVGQRVK